LRGSPRGRSATTGSNLAERLHLGAFAAIPHKVRWLIYANSFAAVGYGYLMIFVTAYLPEVGLSPESIGLILGVNGVAFVVTAIPLGILSDRRGRKWMIIAASAIIPPSLLILALTTNVLYLVLSAAVAGVAEGGFLATWNAIIADETTVAQRDASFSLSFILGNVTFGLGLVLPFAFPWIESASGLDTDFVHRGTMVLCVLLAVVSPLLIARLLWDHVDVRREGPWRVKGMRWGRLLQFSFLNGLIGLGAGFFIPLISLWLLLRFGVPDTYSGPLLAVSNITIAFAAVGSAGLSRRLGPIRAVVLVQGLATVLMLSLAFVTSAVLAAVLYLIRAALMNMSSPVLDSFLMGIIVPEQRGLASAVNSLVWRLPNSVTTVIGGSIFNSGNYVLPIYLAAGFYSVAVTGMYAVFRDVKPTA
jgi:MFS family permease